MMNNNIGTMSSDNVDALFDGMIAGQQQSFQQGYQQTVNAFQSASANLQQNANNVYEPRRTDGYYQQYQQQYPNNGYGAPQQPAPRQTYGYGYTENMYTGYGNMFGQTPASTQQDVAYYGFYNPAYGK